jgi:hypothetical protein
MSTVLTAPSAACTCCIRSPPFCSPPPFSLVQPYNEVFQNADMPLDPSRGQSKPLHFMHPDLDHSTTPFVASALVVPGLRLHASPASWTNGQIGPITTRAPRACVSSTASALRGEKRGRGGRWKTLRRGVNLLPSPATTTHHAAVVEPTRTHQASSFGIQRWPPVMWPPRRALIFADLCLDWPLAMKMPHDSRQLSALGADLELDRTGRPEAVCKTWSRAGKHRRRGKGFGPRLASTWDVPLLCPTSPTCSLP